MTLREKIIELHKRGASVETISQMVGVSSLLVTHVIHKCDDPEFYEASDK
ncbi:hypothetical protein LCGC14_2106520 [marine sediment metagenome]|uniref:Resolvase HTH domain-containing protein n=1 Tax=marine sediment metagenome TaxID=412755 RepID=A0A0F9GLK4_9ZZZZ